MTEVVFKSIQLQKKDFYDWLKTEMTNVGWQNISSRPATDNDVLHSTGESGQDNLLIRMKEYYNTQTTSLISTNGVYFSAMPLSSYTPGNTGVAGVMYPLSGYVVCRFCAGSLPAQTFMTVYYNINKDRVIIIIEWALYTGEDSTFLLMGKPTNTIAKTTDITKVVVATANSYGSQVLFSTLADYYEYPSGATGGFQLMDVPRSRTLAGGWIMSDIILTNPIDGIHSLVDGIYSIKGDITITYPSAMCGIELVDEELKKYRVAVMLGRINGITNFPHALVAFRVE